MKPARPRSRLRLSWTENVSFALVAMRAQKLRTFLTLLGVVAGVATVIMMVSFVTGFDRSVTTAFSRFGTQLVQFQKYEPRFGGGPGDVPEEQRNRRNLTPGIATLGLSLSLVVGLAAGYWPAVQASKLLPVDALRAE